MRQGSKHYPGELRRGRGKPVGILIVKPAIYMTARRYLTLRNAYLYPAVGLDGSPGVLIEREFTSIRAMEDHHRQLLRSKDDAKAVVGYLSVLYWGHFSGQH